MWVRLPTKCRGSDVRHTAINTVRLTAYTSDTGKSYDFNTATKLNSGF